MSKVKSDTSYYWTTTITSNGGVNQAWLNHQTQNTGSSQSFYASAFPSSAFQINSGSGQRDYWTLFVNDSNNNLWGCESINFNDNGPNDSTTLTVLIDMANSIAYFNFGNGDDDFSAKLVPFDDVN
jgi:hypothetical protein